MESENVISDAINDTTWKGEMLGRLPRKSSPRALQMADFTAPISLPEQTTFWKNRAPFQLRNFGNMTYGDCTRAKQAVAAMRMERIETRNTPSIDDKEVIRAYFEMTERLYGGGDTGAYETDALDCWRRPDQTFKDTHGRPLTIDAYLRINAGDKNALRQAIFTAGAHGIAVCLNLPIGFKYIGPFDDWDIPKNQPLLGEWLAGSWGGHSMWAVDYNKDGMVLAHTWNRPNQLITYEAAAAYLDEAHLVIDSADKWRKRKVLQYAALNIDSVVEAVNDISSVKIGGYAS